MFARLRARRDASGLPGLTSHDLTLKDRLQTRDGRLLYLQYGPDPLGNCPFCTTDTPRSFLLYALPAILAPHLAHLAALGLSTSSLIGGRDAASWRSYAAIAATTLAALELFAVNNYDPAANTRAVRSGDIDHFFWAARTVRYVALALVDLALAGLIYLSSTRRAFYTLESPVTERLETATKLLEAQSGTLGALGALRNTFMRDRQLRQRMESYWTEEGHVMAEVSEDAEVVEGLKNVAARIDVTGVEKRAEDMAAGILRGLGSAPVTESPG